MTTKRQMTLKRRIQKLDRMIALQRDVMEAASVLDLADSNLTRMLSDRIVANLEAIRGFAARQLLAEENAASLERIEAASKYFPR